MILGKGPDRVSGKVVIDVDQDWVIESTESKDSQLEADEAVENQGSNVAFNFHFEFLTILEFRYGYLSAILKFKSYIFKFKLNEVITF